MKHIKDGVSVGTPRAELIDGLITCAEVYYDLGYGLVITSMYDGTHMKDSLHYEGLAADLRISMVPRERLPSLVAALRRKLPRYWDVVLEKDHIHVEYDTRSQVSKTA